MGALSRAAGTWGINVRATAHADLFGTLDEVDSVRISPIWKLIAAPSIIYRLEAPETAEL